MLSDAWTRMCLACDVPIVRTGNVFMYTLYYRYRKFARFHAKLMGEGAVGRPLVLPPQSMLYHKDVKFLTDRQRRLNA